VIVKQETLTSRDFVKDFINYVPSQIGPTIVSFISIPIITRIFSPEIYGNYSLVIPIIGILTTLFDWLPMSINRYHAIYDRDGEIEFFYSNAIKLSFISIMIETVLYLALLLLLKNVININLRYLFYVGIVVFIFTAIFTVLQYFLRMKREVKFYSIFAVWKSVASLGIGLTLIVLFDFSVDGLLWGMAISILIILPYLWLKAIEKHDVLKHKISIPLVKEMLRYSIPLVIGNISAWVIGLSSRYVLQYFKGGLDVGIYSASYNVASHTIMFINTMYDVASGPISYIIWEKEGVIKSKEYRTAITRYYLLGCIPAVMGLSALSLPMMQIMASYQYQEGYRIIPIVAISMFFLGFQGLFIPGFTYYKKTNFIPVAITISGALNLFLNFLFVPLYGYMAAAITTLLSYIVLSVLMVIRSRNFYKWDFPLQSLIKILVSSSIMAVIVYYIGNGLTHFLWVNLLIGVVIGIIIYFGILILLKEFKRNEILIFQKIVSFPFNLRKLIS
jgi:O-antigen/teichoic acid export membrane protein